MPQNPPKTHLKAPTTEVFDNLYAKLNPLQKQAVDAIEGPVMIIAGPGTGKTTVLALRIANILLKTDTKPENILALTFTDAGVVSMKRKLQEIIGAPAARIPVHTFHSFAVHIIQNHEDSFTHISGFSPAIDEDQIQIIEDILLGNDEKALTILTPFGDPFKHVHAIKSAISELKKEKISDKDFEKIIALDEKNFWANDDIYSTRKSAPVGKSKEKSEPKLKEVYAKVLKKIEKNKELLIVYRAYQQKLAEKKLYDFDDMLLFLIEAIEKSQKEDGTLVYDLQETYQYVLADEHQDANGAQNTILELLTSFHESPNLFIVGDEKQAIYRFQGASLENFLYFSKKYTDAKVITLTDNYRSTQEILNIAHSLVPTGKLQSHAGAKPSVYIAELSHQSYELEFIAQKIKKYIESGIPAHEIAIIYRNNKHADPVTRVLSSHNIPFVITSRSNLLDDLLIDRMLSLVNAITKPQDDHAFTEGLLSGFIHHDICSITDVLSLIRTSYEKRSSVQEEAYAAWPQIKTNIDELIQSSIELPAHAWFAHMCTVLQIPQQIISSFGGISDIEKLTSFNDYLASYQGKHPKARINDFLEHISFLKRHELSIKKVSNVGQHKVQLMTAHGSKGLEFEYVFIIGIQEGVWSNIRERNAFMLPKPKALLEAMSKKEKHSDSSLDSDEDDDSSTQKNDDEKRLLYVAMTRAKKELWLLSAQKSHEGKGIITSQFLQDLDATAYTEVDVSEFEKELANNSGLTLGQSHSKAGQLDISFIQETFLSQPLSVTALNNYIKCPSEYFWNNLIRVPIEPNKHMRYGTAAHAALERLLITIQKGELTSSGFDGDVLSQKSREVIKKVVLQYFNEALSNLPLTKKDFDDVKKKGDQTLPDFALFLLSYIEGKAQANIQQVIDMFGESAHKIVQTEYSISKITCDFEFNDKKYALALSGKLDAVIQDVKNQEVVSVIDYKTRGEMSRNEIEGKTQSSDGKYKRQLVFYRYLTDKQGKYSMRDASLLFTEPDHKGRFRAESFEISQEEIMELENTIQLFARDIMSGSFLERDCDDKECIHCRRKKIFQKIQ